MTKKQFWMKMDQVASKKGGNEMELAALIRQAYDEDLTMPCGVHRQSFDMMNQLYINLDGSTPGRNGNRYMLCFTSVQMARSDPMLTEPWAELPVRFVVDNALNKPVIGGLVFNHYDAKKIMVVPKQFLGSAEDVMNVIRKVLETDPKDANPFMFNEQDSGK